MCSKSCLHNIFETLIFYILVIVVWRASTPSQTQTGLGWGFILLLPQAAALPQMLAVVLLSQHRVSSSKIIRPCAPCGARCIRHAVRTWSAVCSEVPHLQFGEGVRLHLCMDEWNHPTPVCRWLSLTQAAWGKPIPTDLAPVPGTKALSLEAPSEYSVFHLWFVHSEAQMPSLASCPKNSMQLRTNRFLDLSHTWQVSEDPLKRPCKIWSGSRDPLWCKESAAPIRQSSAGWMPEMYSGNTNLCNYIIMST